MKKEEIFIKIPIGLYRELMNELKDKALKDQGHAASDLRKIDERRKIIRKYNKDIFRSNIDGN